MVKCNMLEKQPLYNDITGFHIKQSKGTVTVSLPLLLIIYPQSV